MQGQLAPLPIYGQRYAFIAGSPWRPSDTPVRSCSPSGPSLFLAQPPHFSVGLIVMVEKMPPVKPMQDKDPSVNSILDHGTKRYGVFRTVPLVALLLDGCCIALLLLLHSTSMHTCYTRTTHILHSSYTQQPAAWPPTHFPLDCQQETRPTLPPAHHRCLFPTKPIKFVWSRPFLLFLRNFGKIDEKNILDFCDAGHGFAPRLLLLWACPSG